jgi:hypothetical protein
MILKVDAINTVKGEEIPSAATINPWIDRQLIPVSGTAVISNFEPAPHPGVTRTLLATGAFTLQSSFYFKVIGGTQTVEVGDLIDVIAIYTNQFILRIWK